MNYLENRIEKEYYYWIDSIRFLAAFAVVASHFRGAFFVEYSLLPDFQKGPISFLFYSITRIGFEAVLIFFILSGFLVGGKSLKRLADGTFRIDDYIIDRFVRIMLPLISALIFTVPIYYLIGDSLNWIHWFGNLFSLQGIFVPSIIEPLWSLSYEVWFYIIIGACCYIYMKDSSLKLKYLSYFILFISSLIFLKLKIIYLIVWIIGVVSFKLIPKKESNWSLFFFGMLSITLIVLLELSSQSNTSINISLNRDLLIIIFAFVFSVFIIFLIKHKPQKKWSLRFNNISKKLADFSYTLYLTHMLVLNVFEFLEFPKSKLLSIESLSLYFFELFVALIFAYLIYYFFERNTKFVKDKIKFIIFRNK